MKLLFLHGWGFDASFWEPLRAALPEFAHEADDRGYFGDPHTLAPDRMSTPVLAVTHSFGTMRLLADPPPGLVGLVAINGFDHFSARPDRPGVPMRVLDRMLRRFDEDPAPVLAEFRRQIGCHDDFEMCEPEPLREDLLAMRDAHLSLSPVPVLAIHGSADPLLPPDLRAATFTRGTHPARRMDSPEGGHLLPRENPALCAAAIRGMIASLPAGPATA
ncbi:alpha/beta fold hydrolase [Novosphingobium sp. 9]|uniref:alpha/beta fold hydrolase n=1 Tax=Novosphingobium sp. 9 TaxID=2025349 RepID=UPI0021B69137|nr:alpha/beta hydrolase [Novosphingobium sp. 9]